MSSPAGTMRATLKKLLDSIVAEKPSGMVFGSDLVYLAWKVGEAGSDAIFTPDISYMRQDTLLPNWTYPQPYPGVPDLAILVVSDDERAAALMMKIAAYLARGIEQVWVLYPALQQFHQYRIDAPNSVHIYRTGDKLDAAAFFPGVEILISDIFKPRDA